MNTVAPFSSWITALLALLLVSACGGSSSSSSSSSGNPPPEPPEGLLAAAGNAEVELEWDAVEGADSYNLYWAPADAEIDPDNPEAGDAGWEQDVGSPHTVSDLENRRDWAFSVTTVSDGQESELSDAVVAHPAPGVSGHSIETDVDTISPDSYTLVGASCGAERVAINGGLQVTNVDDNTRPHVHVQEFWSDRTDPDSLKNLWLMKALNESAEKREVTAYAVCIDPPEELHITTESTLLDPGEKSIKNVSCPETADGRTRFPLGGSIQHDTGTESPDVLISGSYRPPNPDLKDSWRFRLANNSSFEREPTLSVICALPPRGYPGPGSISDTADQESYLVKETSACQSDNDEVTLGGDFSVSGTPSTHTLRLEQAYPDDSSGAFDRWRIGVFNQGSDDRSMAFRIRCAEEDL